MAESKDKIAAELEEDTNQQEQTKQEKKQPEQQKHDDQQKQVQQQEEAAAVATAQEIEPIEAEFQYKDDFGGLRVHKKISRHCDITLLLPYREIAICGNNTSIIRGVVFLDPKDIEDCLVYVKLVLVFRFGRDDEDIIGIRFYNNINVSVYQVWPRDSEPAMESLSPFQRDVINRLGDGAYPFSLKLFSHAPPSVLLLPSQPYSGAPIGSTYVVRCNIDEKVGDKVMRRSYVKMPIRVIYRTDVSNQSEILSALFNNPVFLPPITLGGRNKRPTTPPDSQSTEYLETIPPPTPPTPPPPTPPPPTPPPPPPEEQREQKTTNTNVKRPSKKHRRSVIRGNSLSKLSLSPKKLKFNRFNRSKSETDKSTNDALSHIGKSFSEYDKALLADFTFPQGAIEKPFMLDGGRIRLHAVLDKAWYTHGEDIHVSMTIYNESKRTIRKIRVYAIQRIDICMFNKDKVKNVVADSDDMVPPQFDYTVAAGSNLKTTCSLRPHRRPYGTLVAVEDSLQREVRPDEITSLIATSAVRTPHMLVPADSLPFLDQNKANEEKSLDQHPLHTKNDVNTFSFDVSYYIKIKLTLSIIGGEVSLKLPFVLVNIDEQQKELEKIEALNISDETAKDINKRNKATKKVEFKSDFNRIDTANEPTTNPAKAKSPQIEDDDSQPSTSAGRRHPIKRSGNVTKRLSPTEEENEENPESKTEQQMQVVADVHSSKREEGTSSKGKPTKEELSKQTKVTARKSKDLAAKDKPPTPRKQSET